MLPILYNAILITRKGGSSPTPSGKVVYSGSVPAEVMGALREILITLAGRHRLPTRQPPRPMAEQGEQPPKPSENSSLLAGALDEAKIGEQHAGSSGASRLGRQYAHPQRTYH